METKYLIVGNSVAAISAAEAIRAFDRDGDCVILTEEDATIYSKPMLAHLVAGEMNETEVLFRPEGFHDRLNLKIHAKQKVVSIDSDEKIVTTDSGLQISFEKALIAAGSRPRKLPIEGIDAQGAYFFQSLEDARKIIDELDEEKSAVVIGAGLIGMRAVYALSTRGIKTTMVEMADRIMPAIMDKTGSDILAAGLKSEGTQVILNATVEKVLTENGRVAGVAIAGGRQIPCRILLVTAGVAPNMEFLQGSGIKIGNGILVDSFLRTNKDGIYAAGDIVEFTDQVTGRLAINANWPNASIQGKFAGANMAGQIKSYDGSIGLNSIECDQIPSITMGLVNPPDDGFTIRSHAAPENNLYKKLVFEKGRLVGAILIGPIQNAGILLKLINEKIDVAGLEDDILREGKGFFDLTRALFKDEMEGDVDWPKSLSSPERYEKKFNDEKWAEREQGRRKW